jgi:hypothetical protein
LPTILRLKIGTGTVLEIPGVPPACGEGAACIGRNGLRPARAAAQSAGSLEEFN